MTGQILVAVEDSPIGLETGSVAVQIASFLRSRLLFLHVVEPAGAAGRPVSLLSGAPRPGNTLTRPRAPIALLSHLAERATFEGLEVLTESTEGEPGHRILDRARRWPADLIVLGRSEREADGPHQVGTCTEHVLRFAQQPVLVVPRRDGAWLPG